MSENEISYKIRGAIFTVYNNLGPGLLESIYEAALIHELRKLGCTVRSQVHIPVIYDGVNLNIDLRLDILVEEKVIIELKSVTELKEVYFKQLLTYLKLSKKRLGLLVNFNTKDISSSIRRILND
jgi:GxxExxY protein